MNFIQNIGADYTVGHHILLNFNIMRQPLFNIAPQTRVVVF